MMLDYICVCCNGQGTVNDEACAPCEGYGRFPTLAGKEIIEFLQHRGVAFPMSPLAEEELGGMGE